ncbi:MAG: hypothetical protein ACM31L_13875 [Actinomycetota bacterium]
MLNQHEIRMAIGATLRERGDDALRFAHDEAVRCSLAGDRDGAMAWSQVAAAIALLAMEPDKDIVRH